MLTWICITYLALTSQQNIESDTYVIKRVVCTVRFHTRAISLRPVGPPSAGRESSHVLTPVAG